MAGKAMVKLAQRESTQDPSWEFADGTNQYDIFPIDSPKDSPKWWIYLLGKHGKIETSPENLSISGLIPLDSTAKSPGDTVTTAERRSVQRCAVRMANSKGNIATEEGPEEWHRAAAGAVSRMISRAVVGSTSA